MPFLTKNSKKKLNKALPVLKSDEIVERSDQNDSKNAEKILNEKKDTLRRLNLIKAYKSKKDIQELDALIQKWTKASQKAIEELYSAYISNFNNQNSDQTECLTLSEFIQNLKIKKMIDKNIKLKNGIEMPIIGLGTSLRGKPNKVDNQQFVESVKHALKIGYRHIDTAKCYNNEHLIGQAIKESGVERSQLFIVTKLFPDDMGYNKSLKAFEKSCKQLNVNYIDLYLIHFPGKLNKPDADLEKSKQLRLETWKAFEKLLDDGKCRAIGVSNFMQRHLEEIINAGMTLPSVNQCEFHPYYNNKEIFDYCNRMGILFEGYSPLGKGSLLDDSVVTSLAKKYSKTAAQICLNWCIQNSVVTIPGSTSHERLEENFNVFDFNLSKEDVNLLWTLNRNEKVSWDPTNVV